MGRLNPQQPPQIFHSLPVLFILEVQFRAVEESLYILLATQVLVNRL